MTDRGERNTRARSIGRDGGPNLGDAYDLVRDAWRAGDRDRELALHLMFLAWYLGIEHYFVDTIHQDAEMLYVVGLMARLCSWCIGDVDLWEARSEQYRKAYRQLAPEGIAPSVFEGRGFYGDYFAGQSRVAGGY